MKEKKARALLEELFERHSVPAIPVKFHPTPKTTKGKDIGTDEIIISDLGDRRRVPKLEDIGLGHFAAAVTIVTKGEFKVNLVTRERWIEFYGAPSPTDVRHEFKHYLELLGVEYIRK